MTKQEFTDWLESNGYIRYDYTKETDPVLREGFKQLDMVYYEKRTPDNLGCVRIGIYDEGFDATGHAGEMGVDLFNCLYADGFINSEGKFDRINKGLTDARV